MFSALLRKSSSVAASQYISPLLKTNMKLSLYFSEPCSQIEFLVAPSSSSVSSKSLASLLISQGYKVRVRKLDPYLNIDPGP